jgi:hypothetical protein
MNASPPTAAATGMILPLLLWLGIQLAALGIGAAGVPLSAQRPIPPETLSIQIMVVTQIGAAALLWPVLFANWRASVGVITTALPFLQAAGFLSATPTATLGSISALVCVWLLTLAILPQPTSHPTAVMLLRVPIVLWSIGGAVEMYLRSEFAVEPSSFALGPIVQNLSRLQGDSAFSTWAVDVLLLLLAIAWRATLWITRRAKR